MKENLSNIKGKLLTSKTVLQLFSAVWSAMVNEALRDTTGRTTDAKLATLLQDWYKISAFPALLCFFKHDVIQCQENCLKVYRLTPLVRFFVVLAVDLVKLSIPFFRCTPQPL